MKKGFTIVEVSILFVIFLIVAFLVVPLSLDDSMQAKNTSRWRNVQEDFSNIFYAINTQKEENDFTFDKALTSTLANEFKGENDTYKITYMNGTYPSSTYRFNNYHLTYSNAIVGYTLFDTDEEQKGVLMYDVNGSLGPNVWGKDVFGYDIYQDKFEPFCKNKQLTMQKQDCSKNGTGLCCSNYYLVGGSFD